MSADNACELYSIAAALYTLLLCFMWCWIGGRFNPLSVRKFIPKQKDAQQ